MIETLALFGLLLVLGYLLGIIGFFRAGAAMSEVRALRRLLEEERASRVAARPVPPPEPEARAPGAPAQETPALETQAPLQPSVAPPVTAPSAEAPLAPRAPPPLPAPRPAAPDLESVLTMRWAAWLGAVALLFAGVFLVRYAAEQGLLGPAARCAAAALLGIALLAAAEWMLRRDLPPIQGQFAVDQAPPALAAGGVAILFGAAYGAGPFYDLVPPVIAFAAMAAVSFVGMAAALRFGPLTAAVGIVGAFVAPALVQTQAPSLIALFAYLALATAAAYEVVWRTAWTWLGYAVAIAAALWIGIAATSPHDPQLWAAAFYVPIAAFLGLLLPDAAIEDLRGRVLAFAQLAIIALAGLLLEAAAPGTAPRLALFALTPLAVWKGIEAPRLDRLPWLAALAGLGALLFWQGDTLSLDPVDSSTFLLAAFVFALVYAAVGLHLEQRAPNPVRWSTLPAAVPALTLALGYARVGRFAPDPSWGLAGLLLSFALVGAARRAMAQEAPETPTAASAGAHAAGAVAALALAFGMSLRDAWLTDALALILPGVAWIEARVPLPALRKVALVVAGVTLLALGRWLADDLSPLDASHGGPFVTYAIPALAFFFAARLFRGRRDDATVATLEAGAMGLAALYVTLQVRIWFGHRLDAPFGFDEAATLMLAAAAQALAYDRIAARAPRPTVLAARAILAAIALLVAVGLLVDNPIISNDRVSSLSLLIGYAVPAALAGWASRGRREPRVADILGAYAVVAGFAWTTLQVRHAFHPDAMGLAFARVEDAELWAWSGAWLVYGLALMGLGIATRNRALRLTALAFVAFVCAKVFLWDMADLTGLWRVASFLGLGLALIGLAGLHRRFVLQLQAEAAG